MTRLGELMTGAVVAVAPEDTLGEAAERMAAEGVGSSVVLDGGRLIGILTERDLLGAVAGRVHTSEASGTCLWSKAVVPWESSAFASA